MKKYLFAVVAGLIPALATTTQAYAQNVNKNFPFQNELAVVSSNKPSGETGAATATVELAGIKLIQRPSKTLLKIMPVLLNQIGAQL